MASAAGLLVGGFLLGATGCGALTPAYRDSAGVVTATATVSSSALQVGDCIYSVSDFGSTVDKVQVVPCASAHEGEVYATESGVSNDTAALEKFCTDGFQSYVGVDFNSTALSVTYIHSEATATKTDVQCIVYLSGQMVTASYKDSKQ